MMESQWRNDDLWCVTQTKIASISYTWTIKNFTLHKREVGYFVTSSEFSSSATPHIKWFLKFYPGGNNSENENSASLYLYSVLEAENDASVTYSCALLNCENEIYIFKKLATPRSVQRLTSGWGWRNFVDTEKLFDETMGLLSNDTLTIICEINTEAASFNTCGDGLAVNIPESRLGRDLGAFFRSESLSDVTLIASGKKFNVHRAILAARSPVFSAMFTLEMKEKNEEFVKLLGVEPEILEDMLYFIYTAEIPELICVQHAFDLLAVADKYALERLKLMCENYICPKLTVEDVAEALVLAELYHAERIKAKATHFIQNHIAAVQKTKGWASLFQKETINAKPSCEELEKKELESKESQYEESEIGELKLQELESDGLEKEELKKEEN